MCSICYLRLTMTRFSSQSLGKSVFPFSCCRSLMAVILSVSLSRSLSCPLHPLSTTPTPTPSSPSRSLTFILTKPGLIHLHVSEIMQSQSQAVLIPMGFPKDFCLGCLLPTQTTSDHHIRTAVFFVSYVILFVPPCAA